MPSSQPSPTRSATVRRMWGTREALAPLDLPSILPVTFADVADLGRLVPHDAPHQGLVIEVDPLTRHVAGRLARSRT